MTSQTKTYDGPVWRKGKKVLLTPHTKADIPFYQRWINDPRNTPYLLVTWPMHEPGQESWYERVTKNNPDEICVAIRTHDGTLIGNMALHIDIRKQSAGTGSLIGSVEHQNQGYGTDAKMLLLDYAFNWRGVRKVESPIIAFNDRSQNYASKCGYRHMATIEKEYFRFGRWWDEERFVVFADEWRPLWERYRENLPYWETQKAILPDSKK